MSQESQNEEAKPKGKIARCTARLWAGVRAFVVRFWRDALIRRGAHWVLTLSLFFCLASAFIGVFKARHEDPYLFSVSDRRALASLADHLRSSTNSLATFLWADLSQMLREDLSNSVVSDRVGDALVREFNAILTGNCIHDDVRFATGIRLTPELHLLLGKVPTSEHERIQLNRLLMQAAYPQFLSSNHNQTLTPDVTHSLPSSMDTPASVVTVSSRLGNGTPRIWLNLCMALVCLFLGALWGCWYKASDPKRKFLDGILNVVRTDDYFTAGLFAFIMILLIAVGFINQLDRSSWDAWTKAVFDNPGGLFAFITGAATVVGTYLAVHSIQEMKHTITTYPQLLSRLIHLVKEANESKDDVLFLAYSPLTGAWNVPEKFILELKDALAFSKNRVRVICLNQVDHKNLLRKFNGKETLEKGPVNESMIEAFDEECELFLKIFSEDSKHQLQNTLWSGKEGPSKGDANDYRVTPTRLPWEQMPGYYFFASSNRAIIVVPVGIPRLHEPPNSAAKIFGGTRSRPINVETLGFETTDRHVILKLFHEFEIFADKRTFGAVEPAATVVRAPEELGITVPLVSAESTEQGSNLNTKI